MKTESGHGGVSMSSQKKVTERQVKKAIQRALKHVLKDIENEPSFIIMTGDNEGDLSDETASDIQKWLFRRRQDNGSSGN